MSQHHKGIKVIPANKAAIIIVNLILALLMGLSGCITINPPAALTSTPTPVPTAPITKPTPQLIELEEEVKR